MTAQNNGKRVFRNKEGSAKKRGRLRLEQRWGKARGVPRPYRLRDSEYGRIKAVSILAE